ncbi:MAG: hypothetical protein C0444_04815 [Microbacterium sp.]|nr:hypothetical protein [Microbacterium sp.]MBA4345040.1 hypothetical protein [Microbacterium sp.]
MASSTAPVDNPIDSASQDLLGRAPLARDFAKSIRTIDASHGAVVGVLGPWGHGKSSFINLMREEFAAAPELVVIDFNPWMFSGTPQLIDHFFDELALRFKKLKDPSLRAAGSLVEQYGESISSVAGLLGPLGVLGAAIFRGGAKGMSRQRGARDKYRKASEHLAKATQPIVVVIDDIDRLTSDEIRDVFKLVRLTASFPNVIYLLAFDRARVEQALTEPGIEGRAYLEKILQVSFDLPAAPAGVIRSQVYAALDSIFASLHSEARFSTSRWPDIYFEVIEPLIGNMRDVVRFAASVRPTLVALAAEVESADLLAIEAIRVFRPELFAQLRALSAVLTETAPGFGAQETPVKKKRVEALLTTAGVDSEVVKSLIRRVFPAAQRQIENYSYGPEWKPIWRKEHRLAHQDFLGIYFDRVAPTSLMAFRQAEGLLSAMSNPVGLEERLASIPSDELPDTLAAFESFKGDFPEEQIATSSAAILNQTHRVRPAQVAGFTVRPSVIVIRPVLRMLEQFDDASKREDVAREIFELTNTFSSKVDFVQSVGRRERAPNLVSTEVADELDAAILATFTNPPPDVEKEWALAGVYHFVMEKTGAPVQLAVLDDPDVTRAMLRSVQGHRTAQSTESRHIETQATYSWDYLIEIYGTEHDLRRAVEVLQSVDGESELVSLAKRYLTGWRHESITDPVD